VLSDLRSALFYQDASLVKFRVANEGPAGVYQPTEMLYGTELARIAALKLAGSSYGWAQWQPAPTSPSFDMAGTHDYSTDVIRQRWKLGYIVGLKEITPSGALQPSR
jgi:hypothetical protein